MDRGLTAEIIESSGIGFADIQANGLYSFMKQLKYTDDVIVKSELFKYDKDNLLVDRLLFSTLNDASFFTLNGAISA